MPSLRTMTVVLAVGCTALASASCESVISPCASEEGTSAERSTNSELMDGTWALATINGSAIPSAPGYQVAPGQFIRAGILHFRSDRVAGSCDEPGNSGGSVIVQYVLVDGAGNSRPGLSSSGGFEYFPDTDVVQFEAFERKTSGVASGSRLVVSRLAPDLFPDLVLEFRR